MQIPTPDGQPLEHNLRDGVHAQVRQVGGRVHLELGEGWTLDNNVRIMSESVDFKPSSR